MGSTENTMMEPGINAATIPQIVRIKRGVAAKFNQN
jgi:hypothetical protein